MIMEGCKDSSGRGIEDPEADPWTLENKTYLTDDIEQEEQEEDHK